MFDTGVMREHAETAVTSPSTGENTTLRVVIEYRVECDLTGEQARELFHRPDRPRYE